MKKGIVILALVCVALGAFAFSADAGACRNPASLLLFPYYNTNQGNLAVITITNTCPDTVYVRLVWIDEDDCTPEDQWITLTGYDTFSFIDSAMNPESERGFMYAYVVDAIGSVKEADMDCLIGQEFIFGVWEFPDGKSVVDYGINAVAFQALSLVADGKLHLDGVEYTAAPKTIYFPRFFGQDNGFYSEVIFINLTGGKFYNAFVNLLVYNDNEYSTSTTFEFPCFWFGPLTDVSGSTWESFLVNTKHDPLELWDGNANAKDKHKKTGWIEITGDYAYYFINQIDNASVYAVLIEQIGNNFAADLPWQIEDPAVYDKAMLWSTNPNGT
jgi:hypothetical protein